MDTIEPTEFNLLADHWFIAVIVTIVLLITAIIILLRKISALQARAGRHSESIKISIDKIAEINNRLRKLEENGNPKPDARYAVAPSPISAPAPEPEIEKPYEVELSLPEKPRLIEFYMSTPNPDGSFDADQSSDIFKKTVSLFKFTSNPKNPSTATFEFFSDESGTKDALDNPKRFLEPVCYEENDAFAGAKRIVMQKPGTAVKNGDKWIVDKNNKLTIKYL